MNRPLAPQFIIGSRIRGYARWIPEEPAGIEEEGGKKYEIHVITGNPQATIEKECEIGRRTNVEDLKWFKWLVSKGLKPVWKRDSKLYGDKSRNSKIILVYVDKLHNRKKIRYTGGHHGFTATYQQRNEPFWAVIAYAERPLERTFKIVRERKFGK